LVKRGWKLYFTSVVSACCNISNVQEERVRDMMALRIRCNLPRTSWNEKYLVDNKAYLMLWYIWCSSTFR
jgi:hypothetical protein